MWVIEGDFDDNKGHYCFDPDRGLNFLEWRAPAPIKWEGLINNTQVTFFQVESYSLSIDCFNWDGFPPQFNHLKLEIVKVIDNALKVLD